MLVTNNRMYSHGRRITAFAVIAVLCTACGGGSSPAPATAPVIATQPVSQSTGIGVAATFSVVASGTGPLSYQWKRDGADIAGATSASYVLPSPQFSDSKYKWSVVVRNAAGSAASADASLQVTGIAVFAGSLTERGFADGSGAAARFTSPDGLTINSKGDMFAGDMYARTVRKITPDGMVTTFAGAAGVDGLVNATGGAARFGGPSGVTVDSADNLYVADSYSMTVRKVTPTALVTTVATVPKGDIGGRSAGVAIPGCVAVDAAGNLYITNGVGTRKVTPAGVVTILEGVDYVSGYYGTAFLIPRSVVADSAGNLVVVDLNWGLSKISTDGTMTPLAGVANVSAFAMDRAGNIYAAGNGTIRKITPAGVVTTIVGVTGESGTTMPGPLPGRLGSVRGMAVGPDGTLYVTAGYAILQIKLP